MPDRTFRVLYRVAGYEPGSTVTEGELTGCNVDALIDGGFLEDASGAPAPTVLVTPPPLVKEEPSVGEGEEPPSTKET